MEKSEKTKKVKDPLFYQNFDRLVVLSLSFFVLFTSFNTAQGLTTKILKDNGFGQLGFYSLGVLYCTFGVSSFFASPIVLCLGDKFTMLIGALCYAFYCGAFILALERNEHPNSSTWLGLYNFIYGFILFSAALCGFGAAILWVAEGKYISNCAKKSNSGFFNSFFWASLMASQVIGNLMAAFVIPQLQQESTFFIALTGLCFASACMFLCLREPIPNNDKKEEEKDIPSNVVALVDVPEKKPLNFSSADQPENKLDADNDNQISILEDREKPTGGEIKQTFQLMFSCRMMKYIPIIIWSAASLGVLSGLFVPFLCNSMPTDWDDAKQTKFALLCMVFLGAGEIVGALVFGKVQDYLGVKKVIFVHLVMVTIAFGCVIYYNERDSYTLWLGSLMTFFWGFQDAGVNIFCCVVNGFQFESKTLPFGVYKCLQSFFTFVFIVIESFLTTKNSYLIYFCAIFAFAWFSWLLFLFTFDVVPEDKQTEDDDGLTPNEEYQQAIEYDANA